MNPGFSRVEIDVHLLNNLIDAVKDGEFGFKTAYHGVQNAELKHIFKFHQEHMEDIARELQNIVAHLLFVSDQSANTMGSVQYGWDSLSAAAIPSDDASILDACERGQQQTVLAFRSALHDGKLGQARPIIQTMYRQIQAGQDEMRALRIRFTARSATA